MEVRIEKTPWIALIYKSVEAAAFFQAVLHRSAGIDKWRLFAYNNSSLMGFYPALMQSYSN
jgi:hypothetical protein